MPSLKLEDYIPGDTVAFVRSLKAEKLVLQAVEKEEEEWRRPQVAADAVVEAIIERLEPEEIRRRYDVCESAYRVGLRAGVYTEALRLAGARHLEKQLLKLQQQATRLLSLASSCYLLALIRLSRRAGINLLPVVGSNYPTDENI